MEAPRSIVLIYALKKLQLPKPCSKSMLYSFKKTECCYVLQMFSGKKYQAADAMVEKTDN